MNRTHSEIVVPIEKPAHVSGNFNCRQSGIMLDVHHARPAQRSQVGTTVKKEALLPEAVRAFHGGVSSRLSQRDEEKVEAQQEMEPDDLGETVAIAPSSRHGHLVVHLGDAGQSHKAPGIKEMAVHRDRLLIGELTGRGGLPDDIDGVEGIGGRDASRPLQILGSRTRSVCWRSPILQAWMRGYGGPPVGRWRLPFPSYRPGPESFRWSR